MGYLVANSVEQAIRSLQAGGVTVVAGCTDWYPTLGQEVRPENILNINRIPDFCEITHTAEGWRFGAAISWSDIIAAPLPQVFNGLKQAASNVGSVQIQNVATLVGNICNASPAADGIPPLLALDASVEIISPRGKRTLPLSDFITGVRQTVLQGDELVSAVIVPDQPEKARGSFVKLGNREYLVISIAMVSAVVALDDQDRVSSCRVALGACSPVAQRLRRLEAAVLGRRADSLANPEVITADMMSDLSPISDIRGSANYRMNVALKLCQRALCLATSGGGFDG